MSLSGTLSGSAIRKKFVDYFQQKRAHKYLQSASLVPSNPTVLLTPAGMLPFVPVFLGIEPPPSPPRVVSSQKCARVSGKASDLEFVGRTPRHHTFFEMLGNFSFGDYFKAEVIPWAWEFLTQELQLPTERLWVSVYTTDMEARDIWRDQVGVPESRILFRDEKDNFWGPPGPTGPCGPCSEIYYDWGSLADGNPQEDPELLETDRFIEIWNLVFMELFKDAQGNLAPLEKKNIDTGMGLERIAMVVQGKQNTFETDLLYPIVNHVAKLSGIPYKQSESTDVALKIIADHIRFIAFALADGVTPSNEGRGYIIRMILRRALRYGKKYLGFQQPFLYQLITTVRDLYQDPYEELKAHYNQTVETVKLEEQRCLETLERGSRVLEEVMTSLRATNQKTIPGSEIFKLYDTFGFPVEMTQDIAQEEGFTLDVEGFETCMEEQRQRARSARKGEAIVEDQVYAKILEEVGATEFLGYETLSEEATVKALIVDGQPVESVGGTNQPFEAILDQTPFYAESGGQIGDRGTFSREEGHHGLTVVVNDTVKVGDLIIHKCLFDNGETLRVGETLLAQVEPTTRQRTVIHHTATHLLQAALKKVLGDTVAQAGSYVSPEGARFDFSFNRGLKPDEVQRVEFLINKWILENTGRTIQWLSLEEAKRSGAIAMFDEKYGDEVRVIAYGDYTKELCGGTHAERLGEIGLVKIVSESAIASGIRRIEIVAGEKAFKHFKQLESELSEAATLLKTPVREVPAKVERLLDELKQRDKAIRDLQEKMAVFEVKRLLGEVTPERPFLVRQVEGQSAEGLKLLAEKLSQALASSVIFLAAADAGRAMFVCAVSPDFVQQGIQAGQLVKQAATLCDGGGGGRPNFAQAGGKNAQKLPEALALIQKTLEGAVPSAEQSVGS